MRPRPDAAENYTGHMRRRMIEGASMRPRPDAAENGIVPNGGGGVRIELQ